MTSRFVWPDGHTAALSLSFDDARPSQLDNGMAIFARQGLRATFYVSLHPLRQRANEWRKAADAGHEIGNHTVAHPCSGNFDWSRQSALEEYTLAQMEAELLEASFVIQETVGRKPVTFAYPCGQTYVGRGADTRSYVPLIAKHFLAGRGYMAESDSDPRFCDLAQVMTQGMDGLTFDELRGRIDRSIQQGRWLNLAGHEIGGDKSQMTRPDTLDAVMNYCRDQGVWIDTVAAVAQYVQDHR